MADLKERIDLAERLLARDLAWVAAADSKISAVFGIDAAMLGILAALIPKPQQWTFESGLFSVLAVLLLLASVACLALATFPRLAGPKDSIIYFGTAAQMEGPAFLKRVEEGFTLEYAVDAATQAYRNAQIAAAKYRFVRAALVTMFIAVVPWLLSVWLLYSIRS